MHNTNQYNKLYNFIESQHYSQEKKYPYVVVNSESELNKVFDIIDTYACSKTYIFEAMRGNFTILLFRISNNKIDLFGIDNEITMRDIKIPKNLIFKPVKYKLKQY